MTALEAALMAAGGGGAPDTVALMRVLMEAATADAARDGLARAEAERVAAGDEGGAATLRRLQALWRATPDAWAVVRGAIGAITHRPEGGTPESVLAYWTESFDRLVAVQPEASVALYSLGDPALLAASTAEIVAWMADWSLLARGARVLDLGCGIGRFVAALAPRVATVLGLDISPRMVTEAARRCAGFGNVTVRQGTGRDLAGVADASLDLVLAADVFPYLVEAGGGLAGHHIREAARVLAPGGALLILNYSYRGHDADDRTEIAEHAAVAGLAVERAGTRAFSLWDGTATLLRRPDAG